ncbi:MAG: hypothetical protein OXC26_22220 [Albidovulum sp.]|nr:hypothetical protein [Albidovulum sp.]
MAPEKVVVEVAGPPGLIAAVTVVHKPVCPVDQQHGPASRFVADEPNRLLRNRAAARKRVQNSAVTAVVSIADLFLKIIYFEN